MIGINTGMIANDMEVVSAEEEFFTGCNSESMVRNMLQVFSLIESSVVNNSISSIFLDGNVFLGNTRRNNLPGFITDHLQE